MSLIVVHSVLSLCHQPPPPSPLPIMFELCLFILTVQSAAKKKIKIDKFQSNGNLKAF